MSSTDTAAAEGAVIERAGDRIADIVERWMPSPFLFAIILTYVVFVAGLVIERQGPTDMVEFWYDGFWLFLTFSMQMVLIIMTGFVIAYHPRINDGIQWLATLPSTNKQAVVLVGVVAMVLAWVHWGLGLVVVAIFAREMGRAAYQKGIDVHYPLLCVAGYMGLGLTWHWGLSASAPLLLATPGNEFIELGFINEPVGTSATIFSGYALTLTVLSIVFAAIMLYLFTPSGERSSDITEYIDEGELFESAADGEGEPADESTDDDIGEMVPAEMIDNSRVLGGFIALTGVG